MADKALVVGRHYTCAKRTSSLQQIYETLTGFDFRIASNSPYEESSVRRLYEHHMKTTIASILLLTGVAFGVNGAGSSNSPAATLTSVVLAKDQRALIVHYEVSGQAHQKALLFTNAITDFRYCPWLGERGVAVVATGQAGNSTEFYYRTLYLSPRDTNSVTFKIPAPAGKSQLLGIANTGGDSIVVSAVQHERSGNPNRLKGWMFVDNCPPLGASGAGAIIPFDVGGELKSP